MSKIAEQRAMEAYPIQMEYRPTRDTNEYERLTFIEGYEAAQKDLALTIEDLERIHTFLYAVKNNKHGAFTFTRLSDEQYQEVLRRFNQVKK